MDKKYRILFHGLIGDEQAFKARMRRLGALPETVDTMITKAPVILKKGLTSRDARRYADAVLEAGGRVTIQEDGCVEASVRTKPQVRIAPFEDITLCPECGLKQPKGKTCPKCGTRLRKTEGGPGPENEKDH
jgi:hypothetical protein